MRERLVRVLVAAAAAAAIAWPLVGVDATSGGLRFAVLPALRIGLAVLALGVAWTLGSWGWSRIPGKDRARAAAGEALAPAGVRAALLLSLVAALAALPYWVSGYWTGLVLETLVYVTIAVGLNITIGMAGLLVLGHAGFWAVGAYAFALLTVHLHWNFWLAFPAAGAAAAFAGLVVGLPALRLRGDYLAIVTLGFGEAIRWVLKNEQRVTGGDAGIPSSEFPGESLRTAHGWLGTWLWQPGSGGDVRRDCYWFALALAVVCIASVTLLTRSRYGRALFALREDETAARCMGINTVRVKLLAFTSSAMWAGLAGVIHPVYYGQITPDLFDFSASVLFVAMVVLGGLGSVSGSVLGAVILWVLPALLRNQFPEIQEYRLLVFGALMAAMMIVRPEGIVGGPGRPAAADGDGGQAAPGTTAGAAA